MFKAISGALSLLLIFVVLRLAFPEAAAILSEIMIKSLKLINDLLDQVIRTGLH